MSFFLRALLELQLKVARDMAFFKPPPLLPLLPPRLRAPVETSVRWMFSAGGSTWRLRSKSVSFTWPSPHTKMFSGFRSLAFGRGTDGRTEGVCLRQGKRK